MKAVKYSLMLCLAASLAACGSAPKKDDGSNAPPNQIVTPGASTAPVDGSDSSGQAMDAAGIPGEKVVYFEYDRSEVRGSDRAILDAHARYLSANGGVKVRVEGHADERGSREYNLALGERRAQAVARHMTILGVQGEQLSTTSYGEEKPLDEGHGESSWQRNRRVEIVYPGAQ